MTPYERHRAAIEAMLDPRKWPIAWLDGEVESGRATVFGNGDACIIVALRQYPGGLREVHGLCAAGELGAIVTLVKRAEEWGASFGAGMAAVESRRGWAKAFAGLGYHEAQVRIEKELVAPHVEQE